MMQHTKIQSIIARFEDLVNVDPWYGTAVYEVLDNFPGGLVYRKARPTDHSPIDILYHIINWTEFTLRRIEHKNDGEPLYSEKNDWRTIDPKVHTWKKGTAELKRIQKQIIRELKKKDDRFLEQKVDYRDYDFEYLLNGLADHHIYHLGQITLLKKLLS